MNCSLLKTHSTSLRKIYICCLFSIFSILPCLAQTYKWTGAVSSEWSNDANWSPEQYPANGKIIVIDKNSDGHDPILTASENGFIFDTLTINDGNRLDIGNQYIIIRNGFTCYGTLAVDMTTNADNPVAGGGSFSSASLINWGGNSFLELYTPENFLSTQESIYENRGCTSFRRNENSQSVYPNLYIHCPGKIYKPYSTTISSPQPFIVSGTAKFNCSKVDSSGVMQEYKGNVILESDEIEFTSTNGSVIFDRNVESINLNELNETDYKCALTITGPACFIKGGIKAKSLSVETTEITFQTGTTNTRSFTYETTGEQTYNNKVISEISTSTDLTFKASKINFYNDWEDTNSNGKTSHLIFNAPVYFYNDTTFACRGISFNDKVESVSTPHNLTLNIAYKDLEFLKDVGQTCKFNNIYIELSHDNYSTLNFNIGKQNEPVTIKANSFKLNENTQAYNAYIYGNIITDADIEIKTGNINLNGVTLQGNNLYLTPTPGGVISLNEDATISAKTSAIFNEEPVKSTGEYSLTLQSGGTNAAEFTFVKSLGTSTEPLYELFAEKAICNFNGGLYVQKPINQTAQAEFHVKGTLSQSDETDGTNQFYGTTYFENSGSVTHSFKRPVQFGETSSSNINILASPTNGVITLNTNNNDITFNSSFKCDDDDDLSQKLTINAGTGTVTFNNYVGEETGSTMKRLGALEVNAEDVKVGSSGKLYANPITVNVSHLYEQASGSIVKTSPQSTFTQQSSTDNVNVLLAGNLSSGDTTFNSDVYINNAAVIYAATKKIVFKKNLYIAPSSGDTKFQFDTGSRNDGITVEGSLLLCKNNLSLGGNLTVEKDLVLLGEGSNSAYSDKGNGIDDLYSYFNRKRNGRGYTLNCTLPEKFPDGTSFPTSDFWNATIASLGGKTITVKDNFYDNGVNLNPSSEWKLYIPENENSEHIAEAYNATISYSNVEPLNPASDNINQQFAVIAASENCTGGNDTTNKRVNKSYNNSNNRNIGWDFDPLTIKEAYTVNDDILCIKFSHPVENSRNELTTAFTNITYDNNNTPNTPKQFAGIYKDAACTQLLDANKDTDTIFLKTNPGSDNRWNTDATGSSEGDSQSTDKGRGGSTPEAPSHKTVIPNIAIEKATSDLFETLRSNSKNRIKPYTGTDIYTATADHCAPVLIAVYTGQELHTPYGTTASSQPEYDSHNFIEFQYSEAVDVDSVKKDKSNINATPSLGQITNNDSGITIAGIASIENGKVECGLRGSTETDKTAPYSLYRKFKQTAADTTDAEQTHRVRVSIAGYVDGTITVDGTSYNNWKGYIKEAVMPSGTVSRLSNTNIKDKSANQNSLDYNGDSLHKLPEITVNAMQSDTTYTAGISSDNTLYGTWDTSRPQFAVWYNDNEEVNQLWTDTLSLYNTDGTIFEAVSSSGSSSGTEAKCIEFHVFDNVNDYTTTALNYVLKKGWADAAGSIKERSFDITGGSRPNVGDTSKANRTSGGLRRSSLEKAYKAFKYKGVNGVDLQETPAPDKELKQLAYNTLLRANSNPTECPPADSLYLVLDLKDEHQSANLPVSTQFEVTFDESKCFITDLAGNLIQGPQSQNKKFLTLDITPPQFALSVAAVGKNEMYLLFSKPLNKEIVGSTNGLVTLRDNLELVTMDITKRESSSPDLTDIQFDSTRTPEKIFDGATVSCIKFYLNRNVTLQDITNTWIRVKAPQSPDEESPIIDEFDNAMTEFSVHALSDFAVEAVKPLNAYAQTKNVLDEAHPVQLNKITKFASTVKDNYLPTESELFMQVNVVDENYKAKAYFTSNQNPAIAEQYNRSTKSSIKVWLPMIIPSFTDKAQTPDVAEGLNPEPDQSGNGNIVFHIKPDEYPWLSGKNIQFIFGITDTENTLVTIDNDGDTSTPEIPLYALRLSDPNDITSLDVWQFKTLSVIKQRGSVTIRNNVINAAKKEKTIVQIDMEQKDDIKIAVMTIDGSIITYLYDGSLNNGTYLFEWDGKNRAGNYVARGLYFIRVSGGGIDETRKVLVVK